MQWAIQEGLYDALIGSTALMAVVTGVYDNALQPEDSGNDSEFPYVTIGDNDADEFDTDNTTGFDVTATIHVWSRNRGRKQAKEIQDIIYSILHRQSITVAGGHVIGLDQQFAETFVDPDGLTRHGVQRYRLLVDSNGS